MVHHDNGGSWPPIGAPLNVRDDELQHWSNFDSTVNAVSFGFVATAILISMFLVMAIFERFLRPPSLSPPTDRRSLRDGEPQIALGGKLGHPSPKMNGYGSWVSVLMPGEDTPSFIAHPAPAPCSPERISWPSHQNKALPCSTSDVPSNIDQV